MSTTASARANRRIGIETRFEIRLCIAVLAHVESPVPMPLSQALERRPHDRRVRHRQRARRSRA
jgi:hypothetical protein